jgi:GAF domain-containing protein
MDQAPIIPTEELRLAALRELKLLDTAPSQSFDRLTKEVARILNVPIALISLVDADRQWFYSRFGLEATQTPRSVAFCAHAVAADAPLVVPDALLDPRFADNPLVTGQPHVRAYLGVPLHSPNGQPIGTLCAIDSQPRDFSALDLQVMQRLTSFVEILLRRKSGYRPGVF